MYFRAIRTLSSSRLKTSMTVIRNGIDCYKYHRPFTKGKLLLRQIDMSPDKSANSRRNNRTHVFDKGNTSNPFKGRRCLIRWFNSPVVCSAQPSHLRPPYLPPPRLMLHTHCPVSTSQVVPGWVWFA